MKGPVTKTRTILGMAMEVGVKTLPVGDADCSVAMQKDWVGFLDY